MLKQLKKKKKMNKCQNKIVQRIKLNKSLQRNNNNNKKL